MCIAVTHKTNKWTFLVFNIFVDFFHAKNEKSVHFKCRPSQIKIQINQRLNIIFAKTHGRNFEISKRDSIYDCCYCRLMEMRVVSSNNHGTNSCFVRIKTYYIRYI